MYGTCTKVLNEFLENYGKIPVPYCSFQAAIFLITGIQQF